MQWLMRCVCIGYVVFLTLLLLTSDPSRLIGIHGKLPWLLQMAFPAVHAITFLVLAVLALAARWPIPRWGVIVILASYGGMTEIIQAFVPHRSPEWLDWFQDLAGIAVGAALCWSFFVFVGWWTRRRCGQEGSPENWDALREVVQTPAVRDKSLCD